MAKEFAIFYHARMLAVADFLDDAEDAAKRLSGHKKSSLTPHGMLVTNYGDPTGYRVTGYTREART
jgi:hypothetical protein